MVARRRASSFRRLRRSSGAGSFTVTLSKKASTGARRVASDVHRALEILGGEVELDPRRGGFQRGGQGFLGGGLEQVVLVAGVEGMAFALFLDAQDVGGAAIAGEQVGAVVRFDEGAHGIDAARAGGRGRHPGRRRARR